MRVHATSLLPLAGNEFFPACRWWVLPWLQAVKFVYPVQQRPPVLAACRCLEIQVSKELMVLRWRDWLEINGWYQCPLWVLRKGLVCGVSIGIKLMNGADRGISMLSSIGCLRAMWIHFYVPMPVKCLLYGGLEYKKVLLEEVVTGRRDVLKLFFKKWNFKRWWGPQPCVCWP